MILTVSRSPCAAASVRTLAKNASAQKSSSKEMDEVPSVDEKMDLRAVDALERTDPLDALDAEGEPRRLASCRLGELACVASSSAGAAGPVFAFRGAVRTRPPPGQAVLDRKMWATVCGRLRVGLRSSIKSSCICMRTASSTVQTAAGRGRRSTSGLSTQRYAARMRRYRTRLEDMSRGLPRQNVASRKGPRDFSSPSGSSTCGDASLSSSAEAVPFLMAHGEASASSPSSLA
mmetsp:Transcript_9210/g.26917  ORF Transcript_9210/g.26917 Transcript_9210/m.26917 type:complete len:233 (-) Transcript_9210:362-1060(-)